MRVLVTGGTGMLGRQVVRRLREAEHTVRVLSHREASGEMPPGIEWARADLAAGTGLREAVDGVDAIIHAATRFPMRGEAKLPSVDVEGTRALLAAARAAGVSHILYVSIVGIEHFPGFAYYRWKLRGEELVRESGVPWTIVRAAQFYPFIGALADMVLRLPVAPVPAGARLQPIAAADVATYLVERVEDGPSRRTHEVVGPEVHLAADLARSFARARGRHRVVLPVPVPARFGAALRSGALTSSRGTRGRLTWAEWLRSDAREREVGEYWGRLREMRTEAHAQGDHRSADITVRETSMPTSGIERGSQ